MTSSAEPLRLHPENPHYFLWRGRPTVLITSGEHYGALLNLDFDYERYFRELARHGLNHTRTFSGVYREVPGSFGITRNTLAPKPGRYVCPWARSNQPGYYDGGNKFDLTRWDPAYFRRLRDFMTAAQRYGIVVEFNLFCPFYDEELWRASPLNARNNVNAIGRCPRQEVYTLQHEDLTEVQKEVTRKLVRALNEFDNLYFEVCNEPYAGTVTDEWQAEIVRTIVGEEEKLPNRHLISLNVANGRKRVLLPPRDVSIFNFHYCVPPDTVGMNYQLDRAIGENETGFRGKHDLLYRTEGWAFILSGGALYNNLDYSFVAGHEDGSFQEYASPGGGSVELRRQLGILKRFIESFDFVRMRPLPEAIVSVRPRLVSYLLAEPPHHYAGYLHVPLPFRPKRIEHHQRHNIRARLSVALPPGRYRVRWLDVLTGRFSADAVVTAQPAGTPLTSPHFDNDIAFRIDRLS